PRYINVFPVARIVCNLSAEWAVLPATALVLVLRNKPALQRGEVIGNRACVDVALTGEGCERLLPWSGGAKAQHVRKALPDLRVAGNRATVERARPARHAACGAMELELVDGREEVSHVGRAAGDVRLGTGIEGVRRARRGRNDTLIFRAQLPPGGIVIGG